jgi:hypothetical protein
MYLNVRQFVRGIRGALSTLLIVLTVILFFQNCSDPVMTDPTLSEANSLGSSEQSSFAYKASVSHFAYMSCPPTNADTRDSHFSYRVGAYEAGFGLGLNEAFLSEIALLNSGQKRNRLQGSLINQNVNLQLSLRDRYDFTEIRTVNGRNPIAKRDHELILPKLDSDNIVNKLLTDYSYQNPMPLRVLAGNAKQEGARFVGSLRFYEGENSAESYRNDLDYNGSAYLTLGFVEDAGSGTYNPRSPAGNNKMHGLGLVPNFSQAFYLPSANRGKIDSSDAGIKVVSSLAEVNLESGQALSNEWECPASLKFMIVRAADVAGGSSPGTFNCNLNEDPAIPSEDLKRVRRVLPETHWYVDMGKNCIVEKAERFGASQNFCYGGAQAAAAFINYTGIVGPDNLVSGARTNGGSTSCGLVPGTTNQITVTHEGVNRAVLCPHFASICYRKSTR